MKDKIDLLSVLKYTLKDYWMLGECHKPGTKVMMADGTEKDVQDIRCGDKVLGGRTGKSETVLCPTIKTVDEELIGLRYEGNDNFSWLTSNHPIFALRRENHGCFYRENLACVRSLPCVMGSTQTDSKGNKKFYSPACKHHIQHPVMDFVPTGQLKVGDYICFPKCNLSTHAVDLDFAWLVGLFMAEGSLGYQNGLPYSILISNTDKALLSKAASILQRLSGHKPKLRKLKPGILSKKTCFNLVLYCREFTKKFVETVGLGRCQTKKISLDVLSWPKEAKVELIKGFILGDGWVDQGAVRMSTTSRDLANQLYLISTTIGCHPTWVQRECHETPYGKPYDGVIYYVKIDKQDSLLFKENGSKLNNIRNPQKVTPFYKDVDDFILRQIVEIKKQGYVGPVYSMELDNEDHTYIADKMVVHNSFPYGRWSESEKSWDYFTLIPPEKIELRSSFVTPNPIVILQVDDSLKKVVNSADEIDQKIVEMMDPNIVDKIKTSNYIPIPSWQVSHFAHKTSMSDLRGTSIMKRILKDLIQEDSLRLLHFTVTQRSTFPLKVFKLGNPQSLDGKHRVFVKNENGQMDIVSFDDLWEKTTGVITFETDGTFVKEVKHLDREVFTIQHGGRGQQKWSQVRAIVRHTAPTEMVRVSTPQSSVVSTRSHGFMWVNPSTLKYEPVPVDLLQQRKNPTIVSFDKLEISCSDNRWGKIPLTEDVAYVMGMWITDGCLDGVTKNCLRFSNTELPIIESVERHARNIPCVYRVNRRKTFLGEDRKPKHITAVSSFGLKDEVMKLFGFGTERGSSVNKSYTAKLPYELLLSSDDRVFGALLAGVIDGDGSVSLRQREVVVAHTASLKFADQLSLCLRTRGLVSRTVTYKQNNSVIRGRKIKSVSDMHRVIVSGESVKELARYTLPYLSHPRKKEDMEKIFNAKFRVNNSCHYANVYDLDKGTLDLATEGIPLTNLKPVQFTGSRLSAHVLEKGTNQAIKKHLTSFYCVPVKKIEPATSRTEFVYDLSLEDAPHTYLVADQNWTVTANTGWIPNRSHFETLRNMLAQAAGDPDFCFSEDTQLLTENGWKFFKEILPDELLATFNPKTEELEYHKPTKWTSYRHTGEMCHFETNSLDLKVTPDHNVWVQPMDKPANGGEYPWRFMKAKDVPGSYRMRSNTKFVGSLNVKAYGGPQIVKDGDRYVAEVNGHKIELSALMQLFGFFISEGGAWRTKQYHKVYSRIHFAQIEENEFFVSSFRDLMKRLPFPIHEYKRTTKKGIINSQAYEGGKPYLVWALYVQSMTTYLMDQCGDHSYVKKIPTWVKMLPPEYLKLLLQSMIMGDGTCHRKFDVTSYTYYTSSPKLADDVQEVSLKIGWATTMRKMPHIGMSKVDHYHVKLVPPEGRKAPKLFYPIIKTKDRIKKVPYDGLVFCPTVPPHHLVFARRNGKICVSGQCLIFHHGLSVEYIGAHDKVANLIPEFEFCKQRILAGLFANDALVNASAVTYANANISVRVLMHRYLSIRNQLETMVNNKIFLPVAKARGYWVPDKTGNSGKETVNINGKYRLLDLPKMRWMKLNLIDDTAQKNFIMRLLEKNVIPHKLIAEIFDLEESDILHQLKSQQGTVVDPVYNKARDAAINDDEVRKQVLSGKKTDEWKFPEKVKDKKETERKKPIPRETEHGEVGEQPGPEEIAEGPESPATPPVPPTVGPKV